MVDKARTGGFTGEQARLIKARIEVMRGDIHLGDLLCGYSFEASDRPSTLARDGRRIAYNASYVQAASDAELVAMLEGIARRAPAPERPVLPTTRRRR